MYRIILHARFLLSNWTNDATAIDAQGNPCDLQDGVAFDAYEPRRVCRRLIWFSYAAMASVSRAA